MRLSALVDDFLLVWVALAAALGVAVPGIAVVTRASTLLLAVMVGSVSLTLTIERVRGVDTRGVLVALAGHVSMPLVAYVVARLLTLSPALTAGFVVLGAVTPELVSPTMTELAGGDTALSLAVLVAAGVGSLALVPTALLAAGTVAVAPVAVARELALAVVLPMTLALLVRVRWDAPVARYEEYYTTVSALAVVVLVAGVTAANAPLVRAHLALLLPVAAGALALNLAGYALGWLVATPLDADARTAVTLSLGTRDFAVAAAVVLAAGLPHAASLPAAVFGVLEMTTSAALARLITR